MKATIKTTKETIDRVRYAVMVDGLIQTSYSGGRGYLRTREEAWTAAMNECRRLNGELAIREDDDSGLIALSAMRHHLHGHTYMVRTTCDYIRRNWHRRPFERLRDVFQRDLREFLEHNSEETHGFGGMDYREWRNLYHQLFIISTNND